MTFAFIIFIVLATIIVVLNPRNAQLRWFSIALYTGCASIVVYYVDIEYPQVPNVFINSMIFASDAAIAFSFGMFGIVYSELFHRKHRTILMIAGLIALSIVWILTPLSPTREINYAGYNEVPMVSFVSVSLMTSIVLLITAHLKEKHSIKRRERIWSNLLAIPVMCQIVAGYILYIFEVNLFQHDDVLTIYFLILFIALGIKRGALGVKIKIEMLKADASSHVLEGSTSLINHTVKNEIGKIDILLHQIKHIIRSKSCAKSADQEIKEYLTMASDSVHHIQTMMNKINERLQAIEISPAKNNILLVAERCLDAIEKTVKPDIIFVRNFEPVQDVFFDPVHMKEVIMNLLSNAVEAIGDQGKVTVSLMETDKKIVLQIQDTGKGIFAEALPGVFDPFYSTKKMKNHYGLGLYYCKNVIMKHNGSIYVESEPGKGTSFYIHLPK